MNARCIKRWGMVCALLGVWGANIAAGQAPRFVFRNALEESGLAPLVAGLHAHSAGWGDVDRDGWPELYVGAFFESEGRPNVLLRNVAGKFSATDQTAVQLKGRSNSALFVDLDNDGDLDLYVTSMPGSRKATFAPTALYRNDAGKYTDVSSGNGACPLDMGARSAAGLDYDGDGLLDLLVGEDPFAPVYSLKKSSRLFRNLGGLKFKDVSAEVGLSPDLPGLGVAAGDLNGDAWPDFFLSSRSSNRLFLNDGRGKFTEAVACRDVFDWNRSTPPTTGDDSCAGVCLGDVNRDGRLDVVIGHHYKRPWLEPVSLRLYLNRGPQDGSLKFEDVTESVGLKPLTLKAPHVEIQDFDNDGWPDIYTSIVKFSSTGAHPVIFRNLGVRDGLPRFEDQAMGVNDYPTDEDLAIKQTGKFFQKMLADRKILYMAPGPSADFNRDGRLDLFLANWWTESPSVLLQNDTPGGHWLRVALQGGEGQNRQGIGAVVRAYVPGRLGQPEGLIVAQEIAVGQGYTSGQEAIAHLGLGPATTVDLEVIWPHGRGRTTRKGVAVDQAITLTP